MRLIDGDALFCKFWSLADPYVKQDKVLPSKIWNQAATMAREAPTLTPPNEWVNRVRELDELYTKLQIVTGFTAEQLLEIFAAGYTLEKPDYSKKFAEMENLAEAAQPNEPLTMEELREMDGEAIYWPKNKMWLIVYLNHPDFGDCAVNRYGQYLKLENCEKRKVYRRPPEGEADA